MHDDKAHITMTNHKNVRKKNIIFYNFISPLTILNYIKIIYKIIYKIYTD